jgi:hypothetical protein
VITIVLAIWTGLLGLVSVLNIAAFDWSRMPTWFWFFAYLGFPFAAAWIARSQRAAASDATSPALPDAAKVVLAVVGAVATLIGIALLLAPGFMVTLWPWGVSPLLAHIYCAPFLAYGIGFLYAATCRSWLEVRIPVVGTLVFTVGALVASYLHSSTFNPALPSVWIWFGAFGASTLALIGLMALSYRRQVA